MNLFDHPEFDHHEQVVFCHDPATGLRAIIAVHDRSLGPAAGGCRMHPYTSEEEALTDVLRLSRGMSFKNAVAGLPLGGGKCVIIADPARPDKADVLRAFSRHVHSRSAVATGPRSTWEWGRRTPTSSRRSATSSSHAPVSSRPV